MNKNMLALALCFATFATKAHNATYNVHDRTIAITVDHNNTITNMIAMVITPEEALELLNTSMPAPEIVDGMIFTHDEVTYFIKNDLTKTINLTLSISVNITNPTEEVAIATDKANDDSHSDASYSDSNDSVVSDVISNKENDIVAEAITIVADLNNDENTTSTDDIESNDTN